MEPKESDKRAPTTRLTLHGALLGLLFTGIVTAHGELGGVIRALGDFAAGNPLSFAHLADQIEAHATFRQSFSDPGLMAASIFILLSCTAAGWFEGRRRRREKELLSSLRAMAKRLETLQEEEARHKQTIAKLAAEENRLLDRVQTLERELATGEKLLAESRTEARKRHLQWLQAERLASLSNLIAGITHELNNPLAVISGFAELLTTQVEPESDLRDMVCAIHTEAQRCARIVHNLLTFARQRRPTLTPVDLNEIVRDVLELFRFKMSLDDIQLEQHLARDLPATLGDVAQLQQVVLHLITHAQSSFRDVPGLREITISTRHDKTSDHVVLELTHTGKAFDESQLLHLFEPFQEGSRGPDDDGLGLALCYGLIKEHHGQLRAERLGKRGMRFTVRFSAGARADDVTPPEVARRRSLANGRGVLIVDDEPGVQGLIQRALTAEGYRCATADDGNKALTMLRSGAYDVLILDIRMPQLGGIELYRRLESEFPQLARRTIFTSGDAATSETRAFLNRTDNAVLIKPFEVDELTSVVARVVAECNDAVATRD